MSTVRSIDVGGRVLTGMDLEIVQEMRVRSFHGSTTLLDYARTLAEEAGRLEGPELELELDTQLDDDEIARRLLAALLRTGAAVEVPARPA